MSIPNLGLTHLDHVQFAVKSLDAAKKLYEERLGFRPTWRSTAAHVEATGQRSMVYEGGRAKVMVSEPVKDQSQAARFMKLHPECVMVLAFAVQDIQHTFNTLVKREATPTDEILTADGRSSFNICTPLGEVQFQFIETALAGFGPGFERVDSPFKPTIPWIEMDHLTSNAHTMRPITDWYRDVMGMERYWDVEFHTAQLEAGKAKSSGSGLKSIVMWDKHSGIKFATNEPLRPFFKASQIERFVQDNRGAGIQHIALSVPSIIEAVDMLQGKAFKFLPAPATYYSRVGARLTSVGWSLEKIREPIPELQKRNILIDACEEGYMLQIFQDELKVVEGRDDGAPAFYEVIQREGDRGFGYGNFRALFEAIEQGQAGRVD